MPFFEMNFPIVIPNSNKRSPYSFLVQFSISNYSIRLFMCALLPGAVDGGGLCRLESWLRDAVNNFSGSGGA